MVNQSESVNRVSVMAWPLQRSISSFMMLSHKPLRARRRDYWRKLTSSALHV